eukprot:CAMPEP_0202705892 /NCGR_PEP_ID=MMETSP1385-20130828/18393_1 /ASSEMBLY_ACC=CAM_ASM_000861 /TAXON_ID=933848 /ORGANISM="Elphidium margaritaceum" /LENGTH=134 /DNA_ID=CAMNT_0049364237 /DNA_START=136 /DNA_END=536 /DNA_ORIENTATION=+
MSCHIEGSEMEWSHPTQCFDKTQYHHDRHMCRNGEIVVETTVEDCAKKNPGYVCCQDVTGEMGDYCHEDPCPDPYGGLEDDECLIGDLVYSAGMSLGHIGRECIDQDKFKGTESFCVSGKGNNVIDKPYEGDCS